VREDEAKAKMCAHHKHSPSREFITSNWNNLLYKSALQLAAAAVKLVQEAKP
jgi:hypothetical protein